MTKQRGFTLIEVMMVIVILGILAAIAFPSYQEYVFRGNRSEGHALLSEAAARQERYYAQNNTYATSVAQLNMPANSANNFYQLTIPAATVNTYTLVATTQNSQTKDTKCGNLGLDHKGTRTKSGTASVSDCWR